MQTTDTVLMVRPAAFGFNQETAGTNFFQRSIKDTVSLQQLALAEFDAMVEKLRANHIIVHVVEDTPEPIKPDAVFPNNWFNTTAEGIINVFPMQAANRREEKRDDILVGLTKKYVVKDVWDWTEYEADLAYLEGTGSLVIDHSNKIVYACISPRTQLQLVEKFAKANGYKAMTFEALDKNGNAIYHTNVMLCVGESFAVLCPKIIPDDFERIAVAQLLETTGHENIYITEDQMNAFAGNMLNLRNTKGESIIVMSEHAYAVLEEEKLARLKKHGHVLPIPIPTIEKVGGGSVRCMMAEIFLPSQA